MAFEWSGLICLSRNIDGRGGDLGAGQTSVSPAALTEQGPFAYIARSSRRGFWRVQQFQRSVMSRRCELTGIGPMVGHNVSHSNIKTKRRFLPALKVATLQSEAL